MVSFRGYTEVENINLQTAKDYGDVVGQTVEWVREQCSSRPARPTATANGGITLMKKLAKIFVIFFSPDPCCAIDFFLLQALACL
ncbi:hypothetical protein DX185_17835 [Salmonella enterica]|nr:hypothetical protein [Salmonella enterica]